MGRNSSVNRDTKETNIQIDINLDGSGKSDIQTTIPFFDHMLTLFSVHGFFDIKIKASGDTDVDFHHLVEDVGLVLGDVFSKALGNRVGILRYGEGTVPMDEALTTVNVDLSNRPYLVYNIPSKINVRGSFDAYLAKEFFRAFCVKAGMNLHINTKYGDNEHHVLESIFKAMGRSMNQACTIDSKISGTLSSKGSL
ncbi:MAG: imidazoleglycerol-phosphate dehydratase HisB [Desulfobacteraceae bacterium]|nr:imidazoleglycerol-phosphate dehydratase HisB [Desulfobacteraceae bacterium]